MIIEPPYLPLTRFWPDGNVIILLLIVLCVRDYTLSQFYLRIIILCGKFRKRAPLPTNQTFFNKKIKKMLLIMIGYNADKGREICKRKMKNYPHCLSSNMSSMQQVVGFSRELE